MLRRKYREVKRPRGVIREAAGLVTMETLEAGNKYLRGLGIIEQNERIYRIEVEPRGGGYETVTALKILTL